MVAKTGQRMVFGRCSVFGCDTRGGKQFHFSQRVNRAEEWRRFCQNPTIENIPVEKLHGRCQICTKHFDVRSYTYPSSGRLLRNAFPTLFPPTHSISYPSSESPPVSMEQFPSSTTDSVSDREMVLTPLLKNDIPHKSPDPYHMIEELPELYMSITLPYLEKEPLYLQWVYDIIKGDSEQDRIVYESPCKDDKDGFLMMKDLEWDGENKERLHLIVLPYRPGMFTIRDLRDTHLPLLRNTYRIGKEVIEERYGVPGSQLRIFLQYLPSFYHLNIHFTSVNDDTCGTHVGKAHLLCSVINNLEMCPDYYQMSTLELCLKESHKLFEKFKEHGVVRRLGRFS